MTQTMVICNFYHSGDPIENVLTYVDIFNFQPYYLINNSMPKWFFFKSDAHFVAYYENVITLNLCMLIQTFKGYNGRLKKTKKGKKCILHNFCYVY